MSKKHLFATEPGTGKTAELKVDPATVDRQARDLRASGYTTTVMDKDERIRMGRLSQQIADAHREGRI